MLLRNQADTEQMLTWSGVSVWEKRNLLSFPEMQLSRRAKLFAISLCIHTGCPADKSVFVLVLNGVREDMCMCAGVIEIVIYLSIFIYFSILI